MLSGFPGPPFRWCLWSLAAGVMALGPERFHCHQTNPFILLYDWWLLDSGASSRRDVRTSAAGTGETMPDASRTWSLRLGKTWGQIRHIIVTLSNDSLFTNQWNAICLHHLENVCTIVLVTPMEGTKSGTAIILVPFSFGQRTKTKLCVCDC